MSDTHLFRANDFCSIEVKAYIHNLTGHTGGLDIRGTPVEIDEFLEDGIIIGLPTKVCAAGHQVHLSILVENIKPTFKFSATGRVETIEPADVNNQRAKIKFLQINGAEWTKLKSIFSKKQDEILKFLTELRGW